MTIYLRRLKNNIRSHYEEGGLKKLLKKMPTHIVYIIRSLLNPQQNYNHWLEKNENRIISEFLASRKLDHKPKIAIITPLYNAPSKYFRECVRSVLAQTYENWELCIHNDASTMYLENITYIQKLVQRDPRIKFSTSDTNQNISGSTNSALKLTDADYFILLDNDDALHPQALQVIVSELNRDPDIKYIYTDEDKMEPEGSRTEPILKPDWAPHFLLSMMYTTHISLFRTDLVRKIGGFRIGFEGSQDYDLVLRYTESLNRNEISHIPIPLYHWRKIPGSTAVSYEAKGQAKNASRKALQETIQRRGVDAKVLDGMTKPSFRIKYKIKDNPLISIIIPTYNQKAVLQKCIDSVLTKTTYRNYEIIVVDNRSNEPETLEYLKKLNTHRKIKVVRYNKPFNYSEVNNFGYKHSKGEHILLLNNDTEVINNGWLTSLVELSQLPEVGAVGAMLLYPNETYQHTGIITGIGGDEPDRGVAGHSFRMKHKHYAGLIGEAHIIRNVSGVTGACLMVKRSIFELVGGLNPKLRVAFNDVDFCLEIDKAGYYNLYTPFAQLYHYESISRGDDQEPGRRPEFIREINYMKNKWGERLKNDPYYNPNLTLRLEDYSLRIT